MRAACEYCFAVGFASLLTKWVNPSCVQVQSEKKAKRRKTCQEKVDKSVRVILVQRKTFSFLFFSKKSLFHSFNYLTFSIKASRVANRIYLRRSPISEVRTDSLIVVHRDPRAAWPSRSTFPGKPIKVLIHRDRFFRRSIGALVLLILTQWRD